MGCSEATNTTNNANINMFAAPNMNNHNQRMDGVGIDVIAEENAMEHDPSFDTMKSNMKFGSGHLSPSNANHDRIQKKGTEVSETFSDYGPQGGKSPDTWFDFDEENGIFADNRDTQRML